MFRKKESSDLREFVHLASLRYKSMWRVKFEAKNTNPQHRHNPFANSNFIRKTLYNTKRIRFWPFSVCCFKRYSGVLAFVMLTGTSTARKKTKLMPLG